MLKWFSVKSVFSTTIAGLQYEERVVMFHCASHDEVLLLAEKEAKNYQREGVRFLNVLDSFEIFEPEEPLTESLHGLEVIQKSLHQSCLNRISLEFISVIYKRRNTWTCNNRIWTGHILLSSAAKSPPAG